MAEKKPVIRTAPLGELRAYTISEHELEKLEQGAPVSDLATIGLCLLSAAVTLLVTILSTSLPDKHYVLFFCSLLITAIAGGICTFIGWRGRVSTKALGRQIRDRMPAVPGIQQLPEPIQGGPLLEAKESRPAAQTVSDTNRPATEVPPMPPS